VTENARFGKTGLQVSRIALGGIPVTRLSRSEGVRLVREVLELGVNFIDTARGYGDSEEKIGEAISPLPREELVIASKSTAPDRDGFLRELETSLAHLNTDYLDIYQMHSVSSAQAMRRVMGPGGAREGLERAVEQGKVRHPGFSSHSLPVSLRMMRTGRFELLQVPFNFVDREAADRVIPLAGELDRGVISMNHMGG
jgi:hypothetical protein